MNDQDIVIANQDIVIARHTEPLDWLCTVNLSTIKRIFIYNKDDQPFTLSNSMKNNIPSSTTVTIEQLPNVGREAHTYLYHIIKMYEQKDNFSDRVIFTQGIFSDHISFDELIVGNNFYKNNINYYHLSTFRINNHKGSIEKNEHNVAAQKWGEMFVDKNINDFIKNNVFYVRYGACFNIDKRSILTRSLSSYNELMATMNDSLQPEEVHFIERLWFYVFNLHLCNYDLPKNA